jgi:HK97 family phage prohead protease
MAKTTYKPRGDSFKDVEIADLKMLEDGNGGFTGYASVFGNVDSAKEIVVKGAFANWLEEFKKDGFIAYAHDWNGLPIGYVDNAYEDEKGLVTEVKFHSHDDAQKVRSVMQERQAAGKSVKMSIGYSVLKSEPSPQGKMLKEIKLYEASIVPVGANGLATVSNVKSDNGEDEPTSPTTSKKAEPDINATFVKALLLGDDIEGEMLMSGVEKLFYRMFYQMYRTLGEPIYDQAAKIAICQALLNEFAALGGNAVQAFLADPNAMATASAKAAEMKAGRVLSDANRAALKSWAGSLKGISSEMETLLTETADSAQKTEEQTKQDDDEQTRKASMELELAAMGL